MQILHRSDAWMPFQNWTPFPPDAIVKVWSYYSDIPPVIDQVKNLWWGYETELGEVAEGVVAKAARLDKPNHNSRQPCETCAETGIFYDQIGATKCHDCDGRGYNLKEAE